MRFSLVFAALTCVGAVSVNFREFMAKSIFAQQRGKNFIASPSADVVKHQLNCREVVESLDADLAGSLNDPLGEPTARYCFALKPDDDFSIVEHPLFKACVQSITKVKAEASLTLDAREEILNTLRNARLFSVETSGKGKKLKVKVPQFDSTFLGALNNFYCRRALAFTAPLLESQDFEWLKQVDESALTTNHELLNGLKSFETFSPALVASIAQNHYDFTANPVAMKTLNPACLSAFLRAKNFILRPAQFQRLLQAENFTKMIENDPIAWQIISNQPLPELYENVLKPKLRQVPFLAFYFQLHHLIHFNLTALIFELRGLTPVGVPKLGDTFLSNLKSLLLLNKQVAGDLKAAGLTDAALLFETPMFWTIRAALSVFDESVAVADCSLASLVGTTSTGLSEDILVDQVSDMRIVLEILGSQYWPVVNDGCISAAQMFDLVAKCKIEGTSPIVIKAIAFSQIGETRNFLNESELNAALEAALRIFNDLPLDCFSFADLKRLEEFKEFEELVNKIKSYTDNELALSGLNLTELECKVGHIVRSYEANAEAFLEVLDKNPNLLAAFSKVPHVLGREMISAVLKVPAGLQFLAANTEILHNLRTFEDFTSEHMAALRFAFDVERLGVAVNTFPLVLLLKEVEERRFELNDPAALISRIDLATWESAEMQPILTQTMNISGMTQWFKYFEKKEGNNYLRSVHFNCEGKYTLKTMLKNVLVWHVRQQMRILDYFTFYHFSTRDAVKYSETIKLRSIFFQIFCYAVNIETDKNIRMFLCGLCMRFKQEPETLSLIRSVMDIIKVPLSEQIAGGTLIAHSKISTGKDEVFCIFETFKPLYSNWMRTFPAEDLNQGLVHFTQAVHSNMAAKRQEFLAILDQLGCTDQDELRSIGLRLSVLGLLSINQSSLNENQRVGSIRRLMCGALPLWEARIVARIMLLCGFPVTNFDSYHPDSIMRPFYCTEESSTQEETK